MAIASKISSTELSDIVNDRYVGSYFEVILIDRDGQEYDPTDDDASWLAAEVPAGVGGYKRQVISYSQSDVGGYSDDGIPLANKAAVFMHDGSEDPINLTHVALVWGNGGVTAMSTDSTPTLGTGVNGTYQRLPILPGGAGDALTVDLEITNNGAAAEDWVVTPSTPGYGWSPTATVVVDSATLVAAGAVSSETTDLVAAIDTVYSPANAGAIATVARTAARVSLVSGQEAAFYFNLKQFGFYSV